MFAELFVFYDMTADFIFRIDLCNVYGSGYLFSGLLNQNRNFLKQSIGIDRYDVVCSHNSSININKLT